MATIHLLLGLLFLKAAYPNFDVPPFTAAFLFYAAAYDVVRMIK
jgi:hypothetical protein